MDKYLNFGDKFLIDMNKLKSNYVKIIYEKTKLIHPNISTSYISNDLKNIILEIINNNKISQTKINLLDKNEKTYLIDLLKKTKIIDSMNLHHLLEDATKISNLDKFNVLIGEWNIGNRNPKIKDDILKLLNVLLNDKMITKKNYGEIIYDMTK
jgi:hypothetical protein